MRKHPLRCGNVVRHICDNLDEGLNSRRCREIRKHLRECPNCTAYLSSLKTTVYLYKRELNPKRQGKARMKLHATLLFKKARSKT